MSMRGGLPLLFLSPPIKAQEVLQNFMAKKRKPSGPHHWFARNLVGEESPLDLLTARIQSKS